MGRPLGTKNVMRTPEEKEKLVLEYESLKVSYRAFAESKDIHCSIFHKWIMQYRKNGIEGLKTSKSKNNPNLGKYNRHPSEEEKLKREIAKLEIEVARLKKGYIVKGAGVKKEYVTTFDANMK